MATVLVLSRVIGFLILITGIIYYFYFLRRSHAHTIRRHLSLYPFFRGGTLRWGVRVDSNAPANARNEFFDTLFCVVASIAKADGELSRKESRIIDDLLIHDFGFSESDRLRAHNCLRAAKESQRSFEDYVKHYREVFHDNEVMLENLIDILLYVACADEVLSPEEEKIIRRGATILGVSDSVYARLRSRNLQWIRVQQEKQNLNKQRAHRERDGSTRYSGEARSRGGENERSDSAKGERTTSSGGGAGHQRESVAAKTSLSELYEILGCKSSDSLAVIKKSYRKLVLQHHPDRVIANGLPEEFKKVATERFRQIQYAYEKVMESRTTV